jgi:hypothetical protein
MVALRGVHAELGRGFDAFRDDPAVGLPPEGDQRAGQRAAHAVPVDLARQAGVEAMLRIPSGETPTEEPHGS